MCCSLYIIMSTALKIQYIDCLKPLLVLDYVYFAVSLILMEKQFKIIAMAFI